MSGHIMAKMILAGSAAAMSAGAFAVDADYPIQPVPFTQVRFTSGLLAERQESTARSRSRSRSSSAWSPAA